MKEKHCFVDERRQFKRFKVKQKSAFVVTSYSPALGEVIDISEGGLAFTYTAEKEWPAEESEGPMVFGNHDSCLDLPMQIVNDRQLETVGEPGEWTLRRRCLAFDNLTRKQKFLLEWFIWVNGCAES